jgi:hypothetical protein
MPYPASAPGRLGRFRSGYLTTQQMPVEVAGAFLLANHDGPQPSPDRRDVYAARQAELEACLKAFPSVPNQNGLLVLLNGAVAGFDFVSRPAAYAQLHSKLLKSYVIEALVEPRPVTIGPAQAQEQAKGFLEEVAQCEESRFPSVGHGVDVRFRSKGLTGAALVHEEKVVHTAFFRVSPQDEAGNVAPLRSRRRFALE